MCGGLPAIVDLENVVEGVDKRITQAEQACGAQPERPTAVEGGGPAGLRYSAHALKQPRFDQWRLPTAFDHNDVVGEASNTEAESARRLIAGVGE